MNSRTSKPEVLLYVLGRLTPQQRARVEAAFDEDAEVQTWFEELEAAPDHIEDDLNDVDVSEELASMLQAHRLATANPDDRMLAEYEEALAEADAEGQQVVSLPTRFAGGQQLRLERCVAESAAKGQGKDRPQESPDLTYTLQVSQGEARIHFRWPASHCEPEYGLVLFAVVSPGGEVLGQRLIPVWADESGYYDSGANGFVIVAEVGEISENDAVVAMTDKGSLLAVGLEEIQRLASSDRLPESCRSLIRRLLAE